MKRVPTWQILLEQEVAASEKRMGERMEKVEARMRKLGGMLIALGVGQVIWAVMR